MDEGPQDEGTEKDANVRRLWLSVILRAKLDADGQDLMADSPELETPFIVSDARKFLTEDTFDLRWICMMAGVNVEEMVLVHFRRLYGMR